MVTELLSRGAKIDAATKKGNTALHIASLAGQVLLKLHQLKNTTICKYRNGISTKPLILSKF